jgi:hypothetical protein
MDEGCVAAFLDECRRRRKITTSIASILCGLTAQMRSLRKVRAIRKTKAAPIFFWLASKAIGTARSQEQIFSRSAWDAIGGFLDFPLAWASDDATLAAQGVRRPIRNDCGTPRSLAIERRQHHQRQVARGHSERRMKASAEFVLWTIAFFGHLTGGEKAKIERLTEEWFFTAVSRSQQFIDWQTCRSIDRLGQRAWGLRQGLRVFCGRSNECQPDTEAPPPVGSSMTSSCRVAPDLSALRNGE